MGKAPSLRPKRITISQTATAPSPHVIDAQKLLQPWIAVEGEGVIRSQPITPRTPRQLVLQRMEQPTVERETISDTLLALTTIIWHPVKWYRHLKKIRPVNTPTARQQPVNTRHASFFRLHTFRLPVFHVQTPRPFSPLGKTIASFALVSVVLVVPLQSLSSLSLFHTKQTLDQQLAELQTALKEGASPAQLTPSLFELMRTFQQAEEQLGVGEDILKLAAFAPIPLGKLQSNAALFEAGLAVSHVVTRLEKTLAQLPKNASTADKARELLETARALEPNLADIKTSLTHIDQTDVPTEARTRLPAIIALVTAVHRDVQTIGNTTEALLALLGTNRPARFLVLFQNDDELRPTGGFIGSFGILDIADGSIKKFEIPPSGAYAVQGQLTAYLRAPEPLHTINTRFEFQDSNWFPDFPASAETAMRLYELAHGATVDGVIAINTKMLEGLLDIMGPMISVRDQSTIARDTVVAQIYADIQKNKAAGVAPKQLIATLGPHLVQELTNAAPAEIIQLVHLFNTARNRKDILVYAKDEPAEKELHALAWDGAIDQNHRQDYLMAIHTNIGGGKTDALMQQKIVERIEIQADGYARKQVTIARTHTGEPGVHPTNRDYLRVYVPRGSTLIAASGFEQPPETVFHAPETWYDEHPLLAEESRATYDAKSGVKMYREFEKTVFAGWVLTAPGETSTIQLDYLLSKRVFEPATFARRFLTQRPSFSFEMHTIKQPGAQNTELITSLYLPPDWEPIWLTSDKLELGKNVIVRRAMLDEDQFVGLVAAHK